MTVWCATQWRAHTPQGLVWELIGVFDSEAKAAAACVEPDDAVMPIVLNVAAPRETLTPAGSYFPLASA